MSYLYGLSGKKMIFVLLACQLFFFTFVLMGSIFVPRAFYNVPLLIKWSLFLGMTSILFLIDFFWKSLSPVTFSLNYTNARKIQNWQLRPLFILLAISMASVMMLHSSYAIYAMLMTLACMIALHIFWLTHVAADILRNNATLKKQLQLLTDLSVTYGHQSADRLKLSLELYKKGMMPFPFTRGLAVPGLAYQSWHDTKNFMWAALLEENYSVIKEEFLEHVNDKSLQAMYEYTSVRDGDWYAIPLVSGGTESDVAKNFPNTMKLLKKIPGNLQFREALFSILGPGSKIKSHRDYSNIYLVFQLALDIPEKCGISVGGELREWKEGKSMIFDTAYDHEAWNNSDKSRVVLIVDFLHPGLSEAEMAMMRQCDLLL